MKAGKRIGDFRRIWVGRGHAALMRLAQRPRRIQSEETRSKGEARLREDQKDTGCGRNRPVHDREFGSLSFLASGFAERWLLAETAFVFSVPCSLFPNPCSLFPPPRHAELRSGKQNQPGDIGPEEQADRNVKRAVKRLEIQVRQHHRIDESRNQPDARQ